MKALGSILILLLSLACFGLAGRMHPRLLELRREYRLDLAEPLRNSPPLVAFTTVAIGGFRGLLADFLWLRASKLQEEGRYFEIVQLSDWITKLEPRFSIIWAYHAWNMSYNISVLFNNPVDRWRWVRNGISLLRDEGLTYNPGDPQILRELAWIFLHKLGRTYDQYHLYYKEAWAAEMTDLFGGERPDYARLDPAVSNRMMSVYRLNPARMRELESEYGPLDWRLPQAHGLYWASLSRQLVPDDGRADSRFDAVSADRLIFQAMADALHQGRLFLNPEEHLFIPSPNLDLLPWVRKTYRQAVAENPDQPTVRMAYGNFLREASALLYSYHRLQESRDLFEEFRKEFPEAEEDFETFVYRGFTDRVEEMSQEEAMATVEGAAYQSFFWHALGDGPRAEGYDQLARLCWQKYMEPRQDPALKERTGLPPFDEIREQARKRAVETVQNAAVRARIAPE